MTDREALRAAIVKALPGWAHDRDIDPAEIADAILDAITPVLDEGVTVEWAPRYQDGSAMFAASFTEAGARRYVDESNGGLALFQRHCGPWERVVP